MTVVVSTECTVKFESRGGDEIPSQQVQYGEKLLNHKVRAEKVISFKAGTLTLT